MGQNVFDAIFHPEERTALFIDGANLYSTARALQFDIDYRKLLSEFRRNTRLVRAYYYTALLEDQDFSPLRPLVDWLDYNGYTLVTKAAREFTDHMGRRRVKGDMDIEICVDMLEIAPHVDHLILFSGDGDFTALLAAIQRKGVKVSVISTMRSNPPMVSDELRRQADNYIDLTELTQLIGRPPRAQGQAYRDDGYEEDDEA